MVKLQRGVRRRRQQQRARFLCDPSLLPQVKRSQGPETRKEKILGFGLPAAASPLLPPHLILCPDRTLHWALAQQQEEKDGRRGSKELG